MYNFPKNLYTDVRIEETIETKILYEKGILEEEKVRKKIGAFIRVFDGDKWYFSATTNIAEIQKEINLLVEMAKPNEKILENPIVMNFEVNEDKKLIYQNNSITDIPIEEKRKLLYSYGLLANTPTVVHWEATYVDQKLVKTFYSSKGANIIYDKQSCGIKIRLQLSYGDKKHKDYIDKVGTDFSQLVNQEEYFQKAMDKIIDFNKNSVAVEAGEYTVIFNSAVTGVFAHECFGHKSESDFMVSDEKMKEQWEIGKNVAGSLLSIIDDGNCLGNGYVPYDDEGTKARKNYLIKNGVLSGRLHSASTSSIMGESLTGNGRAINFEYDPIVRMTTTYIEKGTQPLEDIISETKEGIYIDGFWHGSGMSTFTIAPTRAYKIENGKITNPLIVTVVTGNVMKTLEYVDAVSEEFEIHSFIGGGCGKFEQWPLPIGMGGPYTRIKKLKVE